MKNYEIKLNKEEKINYGGILLYRLMYKYITKSESSKGQLFTKGVMISEDAFKEVQKVIETKDIKKLPNKIKFANRYKKSFADPNKILEKIIYENLHVYINEVGEFIINKQPSRIYKAYKLESITEKLKKICEENDCKPEDLFVLENIITGLKIYTNSEMCIDNDSRVERITLVLINTNIYKSQINGFSYETTVMNRTKVHSTKLELSEESYISNTSFKDSIVSKATLSIINHPDNKKFKIVQSRLYGKIKIRIGENETLNNKIRESMIYNFNSRSEKKLVIIRSNIVDSLINDSTIDKCEYIAKSLLIDSYVYFNKIFNSEVNDCNIKLTDVISEKLQKRDISYELPNIYEVIEAKDKVKGDSYQIYNNDSSIELWTNKTNPDNDLINRKFRNQILDATDITKIFETVAKFREQIDAKLYKDVNIMNSIKQLFIKLEYSDFIIADSIFDKINKKLNEISEIDMSKLRSEILSSIEDYNIEFDSNKFSKIENAIQTEDNLNIYTRNIIKRIEKTEYDRKLYSVLEVKSEDENTSLVEFECYDFERDHEYTFKVLIVNGLIVRCVNVLYSEEYETPFTVTDRSSVKSARIISRVLNSLSHITGLHFELEK